MLRINQLAKELGVSNHVVLDALEKHLGVAGKSHSSNLTEEQINTVRRVVENKSKGEETPSASPLPPATAAKAALPTIKIVKPILAPPPPPPAPPAVLIKKSESPAASSTPVEAEPVAAPAAPEAPTMEQPSSVAEPAQAQPGRFPIPGQQGEGFSRLRISQAPPPSPRSRPATSSCRRLPRPRAGRKPAPAR